jgi:hypothetical protein
VSSVGDHRPVGRDRIRSRPKNLKTCRDQENFQKICQDIQLDKSILKFSIGSRPKFGSRLKKFQPGRLIPVATVFGSRSDIFLGRDPYSVATLKKVWVVVPERVEVPNTICEQRNLHFLISKKGMGTVFGLKQGFSTFFVSRNILDLKKFSRNKIKKVHQR